MKLYDFLCRSCRRSFEQMVETSDIQHVACPHCQTGIADRQLGGKPARSTGDAPRRREVAVPVRLTEVEGSDGEVWEVHGPRKLLQSLQGGQQVRVDLHGHDNEGNCEVAETTATVLGDA
jgi:putative FmdB family regulatory protein